MTSVNTKPKGGRVHTTNRMVENRQSSRIVDNGVILNGVHFTKLQNSVVSSIIMGSVPIGVVVGVVVTLIFTL